jgi:anthranilate phosphoribosyltransferase
MPLTPQEALQRTIEHREIFHDEMVELMRSIMRGEVSPDDDRGDPHRIARQEGNGRRDRGRGLGSARVRAQGAGARSHAPGRHRRHGRRWREYVQHFHRVDVRRRRGGCARGQARRGAACRRNRAARTCWKALGAHIELAPEQVAECIERTGIGFMFAPLHHPAMQVVSPVRREMGVRTMFNILGPLTNPAGAPNILMGVFHPDLVGIQVRVLQELGAERALVVWGRDGMDEISLGAATLVGELRDGVVREYEVHPEDFGIAMAASRNLRVADSLESKAMVLTALDDTTGLPREIVALNAGAALYVAGLADSIADGIALARNTLASGAARAKLDQFLATTRELSIPA